MKFLADESVDDPVVVLLRENTYDVDYIKELCPGANDEVVLKLALGSNSILITMDKDFGELVYRKKTATYRCHFIEIRRPYTHAAC